jgi:hypothetical protein
MAATGAPIPIPALAPVVRSFEDEGGDPEPSAADVAVLVGVVPVLVGVVEAALVDVVVGLVVEVVSDKVDVLECVETTAPSPLRTMPRFSEQQIPHAWK